MADIPGYVRACLQTGKLAFLAILVSGGIVLQILVSFIFPELNICTCGCGHLLQEKHYSLVTYVCMTLQACALYDNWWPLLTGMRMG